MRNECDPAAIGIGKAAHNLKNKSSDSSTRLITAFHKCIIISIELIPFVRAMPQIF